MFPKIIRLEGMKKGKAVQGIPAVFWDEDRLVRVPRSIGAVVQADGTLRPMPSCVVRQSSSVPSISVRRSWGKTITDYEDDEESDDKDVKVTAGDGGKRLS